MWKIKNKNTELPLIYPSGGSGFILSKNSVDKVQEYLKTVKENNEFKIFRENRTTITYRYFDKEGFFMIKIDITPEKYLD